MNQNADFDRIAQSWLQDGPTEMPDRSLQAALDEVHVTSQRRFGAARRTFNMNGNAFADTPRPRWWACSSSSPVASTFLVTGWAASARPDRPRPLVVTFAATDAVRIAGPAMLKDAPYVACSPGGGAPNCLRRGPTVSRGMCGRARSPWMCRPAGSSGSPTRGTTPSTALLVDAGTVKAPAGASSSIGVGAVAKDPCDPTKGTYDRAETGTVDGLVAAMSRWPGFEATAPAPTGRRRVQRAAHRAHFHPHSRGLLQPVAMDDPPGRGRRRVSDGRCTGAIAPGHVQDRGRQRHAARHPDDGLP